jgi:DNA-binding transcriptional LysR family regulator
MEEEGEDLIDSLREFLKASQHLNLTRAAQELHMSQSTLSRHIKELEGNVGFQLFKRSTGGLLLTGEGARFADGLEPLLNDFDSLLLSCRQLGARGDANRLTVCDPTYGDAVAERFMLFLRGIDLLDDAPALYFVPIQRQKPIDMILRNELDAMLAYRYNQAVAEFDEFHDQRIWSFFLGSVQAMVWMKKTSGLSLLDRVGVEDLKGTSILIPNDHYNSLQASICSYFSLRGLTPRFRRINISSKREFFQHVMRDDEVFITPWSEEDFRMSGRYDLCYAPLDAPAFKFDSYVISSKENPSHSIMQFLADQFSETLANEL